MTSLLHQLQSDLSEAIRFKDAATVNDLPIRETNGITKETRLEVYRNGFWIRLTRSLKEDFIHTFKKLNEDEIETLIQRFVREARPGYHLLGEVSLAFADFVSQIRPDLTDDAALDAAILVSEMNAWPYILATLENRRLTPAQLGEMDLETVEVAWSTSTQTAGSKIIAQVEDVLTLLEPAQKVLDLVKCRKQIRTFEELLEKISELDFTPDETSAAIAFLTQNEILFFLKKQ